MKQAATVVLNARRWARAVLMAALGVGVVYARAQVEEATAPLPIRGLRLPLEYYPDGQVRVELRAAEAETPADDQPVYARGVEVEFFDATGAREALVKAEDCRYDRQQETLVTDRRVSFDGQGGRLTGTGMLWKRGETSVRLLNDVRCELPRTLRANRRADAPDTAKEQS